MKKLILMGICSVFLAACNTSNKENKEIVLEVDESIEQTEISNEVENEDFKLIIKSEKQNFSIDERIEFTAELHYIGSNQEMTVYSNATLIDYQLLSEDGTFELKSEGEDSHESFVIQKNEPYVTTFEFDKKDEGFGSLLDSMVTGNYTIKIQASYGVENILDEKNLATELNFKLTNRKFKIFN